MRLRFPQPFLVIAVLLGGFSAFLAYEKKYEPSAAMAGVAVAAAVASQNSKKEDSEKIESWYEERHKEHQEDMKRREEVFMWDKAKLMQLTERTIEISMQRDRESIQEIARLNQDMGILNHQLEQQVKMNELEIEIARLRQSLTDQPKTALLPESILDPVQLEIVMPEEQVIEPSKNHEENP